MKLGEIKESTFRKVCDKYRKICKGCPFHKPWREGNKTCIYRLMMTMYTLFGRRYCADDFDSIEIDLREEEE